MVEYNKVNVKLSDSQLNKLKNSVKDQTEATLRMNVRMFNGNNLPHELLLTTRQTTKSTNAIKNNMSTDIKLSRAQISKIIQHGGFLGSLLSKLSGPLMKVAVRLKALEDSDILLKKILKQLKMKEKSKKEEF